MIALEEKKILLGVTGSIAAYKSLILLRLLQKSGAIVKVIMTEASKDFVGELSFSTLTGATVYSGLSKNEEWNNHVELGLWADVYIIAPASANSIAKCAHGIVDNLLTAVYLSAKCDVFFAPAMDLDMWAHPSTKNNLNTLERYGNHIIPVGDGQLASGLVGPGRLAEPADIYNYVLRFFEKNNSLRDKKILITAGPTYEALDPVRFIGNRSSGKMGIQLAKQALAQAAEVILILGPSAEPIPSNDKLIVHRIESADQMYDTCHQYKTEVDVFIFAAAVADYKPQNISDEKIKKNEDLLQVNLIKNKDIAASIGADKKSNQIIIGFALETEKIIEHATAKMHKKNMDMIVINTPKIKNTAFGYDTNQISILHRNGERIDYDLKPKSAVAIDILLEISELLKKLK